MSSEVQKIMLSSPGGRRRPRPQSCSAYEPLLQSSKLDKPKPPPKPPLLKSFSSTVVNKHVSPPKERSDSSEDVGGGYFQPGGASSIGYCLSSFYKPKVGPRTSEAVETSKPSSNKPKFVKQDDSRPSLMSLPAKFQVSFEERNRQSAGKTKRTKSVSSVRRPPPPVPTSGASSPVSHDGASSPVSHGSPTTLVDPIKCVPSNSTPSSNSINEHRPIHRASSVGSYRSVPSRSSSSCSNTSVLSPTISSRESAGVRSRIIQPVTFAQPPPREMDYTEREHPRNAFEYLDMLRHKGELCDAILCVNNKELKAHRVVLAACSQYFESMFVGEFAEPPGEPVVIEEVSEDALVALVDFAYTSHLKLTDRNVHAIVEAADVLQLVGVKGACFKFFKQQINKSNCIKTWLFAESQSCTELTEASLRYIESNFVDIVRGREFLDLDQLDVIISITSREDLAITSEEQVYEALLSWIHYKMEKRKKDALAVLKGVRFPSMPKEYLLYIVDHEPLIQEDPDILQVVSPPTIESLHHLWYMTFHLLKCACVNINLPY